MEQKFPKGFFWGAAISAHQTEGGCLDDWSEWEKETAKIHQQNANSQKWPDYILNEYPSPLEGANYISGGACDHYNRFLEDFEIAKSLGLNAFRFSIEWSKIERKAGQFDQREIEHYKKVVMALKERGMEPFVTLWHWPLPLWVSKKGGWNFQEIIDYFARYVTKVVSAFKDDIRFWLTINEPEVYTIESYLLGHWPPQKRSLLSAFAVIQNLIKTHKKAYRIIKSINPKAQVGIAKHNVCFEAYKNKPVNQILKKAADFFWNFYFLNQIKNEQDFIGLNYYFHSRINYGFSKNENKIVSDMGWELYPQGIYYVLKDLKKYQKPIYITENGLADARDKYRAWYIKEVLKNVYRAIGEGVDVRGYFYWSLLDNFEWDKGFWPRFGLVKMDYKNLKRTIRPSAKLYAKIAQTNCVSEEDEKEGSEDIF